MKTSTPSNNNRSAAARLNVWSPEEIPKSSKAKVKIQAVTVNPVEIFQLMHGEIHT